MIHTIKQISGNRLKFTFESTTHLEPEDLVILVIGDEEFVSVVYESKYTLAPSYSSQVISTKIYKAKTLLSVYDFINEDFLIVNFDYNKHQELYKIQKQLLNDFKSK